MSDAGRDADADPRLDGDAVRTVRNDGLGPVHLVGVVHDHPASAYRAQATVEAHDPDALALEVAPVALPYFVRRAASPDERPTFGGEFSAAIDAADGARVVGIDAPNRRFVAALLRRCAGGEHSPATVKRVLRGTATVTREALACRLAAAVDERTSFDVDVGERVEHDADPADDPATQAADEARQVAQVERVLAALERPPAVRLRDETREACMARELHALRAEGSVVAVVGRGHLDAVAGRLEASAADASAAVEATAVDRAPVGASDDRSVGGVGATAAAVGLFVALARRASDA